MPLIRDPADWAREAGWINRRKAENIATKLCLLALTMENAMPGDSAVVAWAKEVRQIAKLLGS